MEHFKDDADHELGLFKILALYATDTFNKQETRTLKAYFDASESRPFEAGLNLAIPLFDVGVQYGYRQLSDPNTDRMGDGYG